MLSDSFRPLQWALLGTKVYVVGTLLYAAATVLTSQSQSMVQLIMFRVIQGLGAGIIVPVSMAAVTRYWRDKRLGRIIGLLGSMQVVATLIGAPLGGWLTSVLGWRVAFASPALLSITALALSLSLVPFGHIDVLNPQSKQVGT